MSTKLTPMMRQYLDIKAQYPDCFLFFRLGDFYEMFDQDAILGSRILGITLTARNKGENQTPMCGMPFHSAKSYIQKLVTLGHKVAICEQVSDPTVPGIVKREVVRVITPATVLDDEMLSDGNNFLLAIYAESTESNAPLGLAFCDISTGEFFFQESNFTQLADDLEKIKPKEFLVNSQIEEFFQKTFLPNDDFCCSIYANTQIIKTDLTAQIDNGFCLQAANALHEYLTHTQKSSLENLKTPEKNSPEDFMILDKTCITNLEIFETFNEKNRKGSLFEVLDQTLTPMGGRMLKAWILRPLKNIKLINQRLDAVSELFGSYDLREDLRECLKHVRDIERLTSKLSLNSGNAVDMLNLAFSLAKMPKLLLCAGNLRSDFAQEILKNADDCQDLRELIEKNIHPDAPTFLKEGGLINSGINAELDELREISRNGKSFIQALQEKEICETGINSLKIRYNKVFGYYIEISKSNLDKLPSHYIRKQTLVNAERFITEELKVYEEKVLGAEEKIKAMEYEIFNQLREQICSQTKRLQQIAAVAAKIDVICALAHCAVLNNYCRAQMHEGFDLKIEKGRHPTVEKLLSGKSFIANNLELSQEKAFLSLITGPNMGGKSTFLRQTALISLMAQIGSFVPTKSAFLPIVDRIFTRVGASDNLAAGESTFMVEMKESSEILRHATDKSLIVLDEIGRGTATYDGLSLAWAIAKFIHDKIGAKTLFATHYHELTKFSENLSHSNNLSVKVAENSDGVVFLYEIQAGAIDKSYGIEVAKIAGLPHEVVLHATETLAELEKNTIKTATNPNLPEKTSAQTLFDFNSLAKERHFARLQDQITKIKNIPINEISPINALLKLQEIKENLDQIDNFDQ